MKHFQPLGGQLLDIPESFSLFTSPSWTFNSYFLTQFIFILLFQVNHEYSTRLPIQDFFHFKTVAKNSSNIPQAQGWCQRTFPFVHPILLSGNLTSKNVLETARAEFESLHSRPLDDLQTTLSQKSSCLYFLFLESLLFLFSIRRYPRAEEAVTQHSCFFTVFRSLKYELPPAFQQPS